MKTTKILALPLLALALNSCTEDFLDRVPTDALSSEIFWNTESDAKLALTGCYRQLYSPYRPEEMWFWDCASDNAFCFHNNKDYRAIGNGSMAASGVSVHNYFTYTQIRTCNEYLANESTIQFSTDALREQYRDEVRMIRAMSLYFRVQTYGDFPFSTEVFETIDEAMIPRTSAAELYAFVKSEMEDIVKRNYLPTTADAGRITIGAAEAFLMRVNLYTGDYANTVKYAEMVMNSHTYQMPGMSYEESFLKANQYNSEVILSFEHNKAGGFGMWVAEFFPNGAYGGWSSLVPTISLLESYETINGLTIDQDPSYDAKNPFVNRDPRLRASILYPGQCWDKYADSNAWPQGYPSIIPGSGDYHADANNACKTGMNFKKFYSNPSEFGDIWGCDRNFPILRYAEVLLSYAEAKIELGQIDQTVYDAINQVRQRAGMPMVDKSRYADAASLRTLVRRERRVEFVYEGLRRWDILRWGIAKEVMSETIWNMDGEILSSINKDGDHDVSLKPYTTYEEVRQFTVGKNELLPVPQSVIDNNEKITQNPGY